MRGTEIAERLGEPIKIYWAIIVRYGRVVDEGALPVFSVGSEEEAEKLLVLTCPRNYDMDFVARELAEKQTAGKLEAFSTRLDGAHDKFIEAGLCTCQQAKS